MMIQKELIFILTLFIIGFYLVSIINNKNICIVGVFDSTKER
jgi:hypothetical protein